MGGCLKFLVSLLFRWIETAATLNARTFGREHAVPGPEAVGLAHRLEGAIVMGQPGGGIREVRLPALEERTIREPAPEDTTMSGVVSTVSGPDRLGRIVYLEESMVFRLSLRVTGATGAPDRILFTRFARPVEAIHGSAIGESLALAPVGGKCALLAHLNPVQMEQPSALLQTGTIEIWNIDRGTGVTTEIVALDDGLFWFPDGRHLAYAALTPRDQVDSQPLGSNEFGIATRNWLRIPAVYILDTETNGVELLHGGRRPVVSSDGKSVLVSESGSGWRLVDIASHQSRPARAPGQWGAPFGLVDSRLVIYPGLPTVGTPIRLTEFNSPLRGPKLLLTIKAADLETAEFQTLVPYYDSRDPVSFGILDGSPGE